MTNIFDAWDAKRAPAASTGQPVTPRLQGGGTPYGLAALAGEVDNLLSVPIGSGRNDQLNRSAVKMYGLAAAGQIDDNTVTETLGAADGGLDHPATRRTLQSAREAVYGRLGARTVPEPTHPAREVMPWEQSDDPFSDHYVAPSTGSDSPSAKPPSAPSPNSTDPASHASAGMTNGAPTSATTALDAANGSLSSTSPPDLEALQVAAEVRKQRVNRQARKLVDAEDALRDFREPIYASTLTDELAIPAQPVAYRIDKLIPKGANVLLTAQFKAGKALAAWEEVQTPTGPVKIGELEPGDVVLHPSGRTVVEGVYPQGERELFDVRFNDDVVVRCDAEHLWTAVRGQQNERTVTLGEMMRDGIRNAQGRPRWHVPIARPAQFEPSAPLPLDPYLVGALIGDGGLTAGSPRFTNTDEHVIDRVSAALPEGVTLRRLGDSISFGFPGGGTRTRRNPLTAALDRLGMLGVHSRNKRIPHAYRYASVTDRLELLRGLMDTDGAVGKRGAASTSSASETLADDIAELVRSLGGTARVQRRSTQWPAPDGSLRRGVAYTVSIRFADLCPFSLPRHVARYRPGARRGIRRSITSVTPAGRGDAVCIKVAAKDGLFLTRGFVVTHNTTAITNASRSLVDGDPFLGRYAVEPFDGRVGIFNYEVSRDQYREWLRDVGFVNTDKVTTLPLRGFRIDLRVPYIETWVVEWLKRHEVTVWIVDPFARAATGIDENSNTEVGQFLDTLDVIKDRAGVSELILPTHTGRAEMEPGDERSRGATRLEDWCDVRWLLTKDKNDTRYFRATGRDVETDEAALKFEPATRRLTITGGDRYTVERDTYRNAVLTIVGNRPGVNARDLREGVRQILKRASAERVKAAVDDLVDGRQIHTIRVGHAVGHHLGEPPHGAPPDAFA